MIITHQKLTSQVQAPKTWDKPTAQAQIGDVINSPFMAVMQVADRELLEDGRVRLLVKPVSASHSEEWILDPDPAEPLERPTTQPENTAVEQPSGLDSPSCALQPAWLAMQEYDRGVWWGKQDANAQRKPMYTQASCPHSTGYLDAFFSFMQINQQFKQPPETKKPIEWRVVFSPDWDWDWYKAMVGDKCIGKYCSVEEGEAAAQKYIAAELARQHHRELVIAAYPG